ncbi:hypothetical protein FJZ26_04350 [Candidatus Parvarchaeota archaeon]|nr:hypothetical protein [Candidatus Parvarchaeota archaeon]
MEMSIDSKTENKLFDRVEVSFSVQFEKSTPSRKEIREELAKHTGASSDLIVIGRLGTQFGKRKANGQASLYKNKEALLKSSSHLLQRDGHVEKKKRVKVKKATAAAKPS